MSEGPVKVQAVQVAVAAWWHPVPQPLEGRLQKLPLGGLQVLLEVHQLLVQLTLVVVVGCLGLAVTALRLSVAMAATAVEEEAQGLLRAVLAVLASQSSVSITKDHYEIRNH